MSEQPEFHVPRESLRFRAYERKFRLQGKKAPGNIGVCRYRAHVASFPFVWLANEHWRGASILEYICAVPILLAAMSISLVWAYSVMAESLIKAGGMAIYAVVLLVIAIAFWWWDDHNMDMLIIASVAMIWPFVAVVAVVTLAGYVVYDVMRSPRHSRLSGVLSSSYRKVCPIITLPVDE